MDRPKLEVADIFRRYGEAYRQQHDGSLSTAQRRVMTAIEVCRTAALGGHLERCDCCSYERPCYSSCRDRHCPKRLRDSHGLARYYRRPRNRHVRCHHHLACGSPGDRHRRHCVRLYCYCCLCSCWARFHTLLYCPEIRVAVLGLASLLHPVRVLSGHRCFCCLRHRKSDYRNHGPSAEGHY